MKSLKLGLCILTCTVFVLSTTGCGKPEITLKNKKVEANKNGTLLDLINVENESDKYSIEAKNTDIDLGKCGKYTATYVISKEDTKVSEEQFSFTVVDTTAPTVEVSDSITVKKGSSKSDILKAAEITDNANGKIQTSISGNYNLNKVGSYKITIKAKDANGNTTKEKTTLVVSENKDEDDNIKTYAAEASEIKGYWENSSQDKLMIIKKEKNKFSNLKIVFSVLSEGMESETDGGSIQSLTKSDNTYKLVFTNSENIKMKITITLKDDDKLELKSKYKAINGTYKRTTKDAID